MYESDAINEAYEGSEVRILRSEAKVYEDVGEVRLSILDIDDDLGCTIFIEFDDGETEEFCYDVPEMAPHCFDQMMASDRFDSIPMQDENFDQESPLIFED